MSAQARVLRTVAVLFAVAAAIFGILDAPLIASETSSTPHLWTVLALIGTLGLPIVLGAAAPAAPIPVLRGIAVAVAVSYLLALITLPAVLPETRTAAAAPWLLQLTAIGTTAAALALPGALVAAVVVLTSALVTLDRWSTAVADLGLIPLQDGLYNLLFCAVFAALALGARRAADAVDAAAREALTASAAAQDERVRSEERSRVNALVHDHVLTTLLVAGRAPGPSQVAADAATDALRRLRSISEPAPPDRFVAATDLLDRFRALLRDSGLGVEFTVAGGDTSVRFPTHIVEVLIGATSEALRNVRLHAAATRAEVQLQIVDRSIEVTILDDGVGFVPERVPATRLGIAGSIVGRLRAAGGDAEVRSQPGRGTAVWLRWSAR